VISTGSWPISFNSQVVVFFPFFSFSFVLYDYGDHGTVFDLIYSFFFHTPLFWTAFNDSTVHIRQPASADNIVGFTTWA